MILVMIGDMASIATLILFVIYFVGRTITVFMEKQICYDEISFLSSREPDKYDIIEEVNTIAWDDDNWSAGNITMVVLTSKQGIRNIKVYEIAYDDNYNEIEDGLKEIDKCDFLNVGQSFAIITELPELIPKHRIVYYTQDFKKVTFNISDNLKSGVASEMLQAKHTLKSILYYLFR